MKNMPIELIFDDLRMQGLIESEPGYRFVNDNMAMVYSTRHYMRKLPVSHGQPYRVYGYRLARMVRGTGVYVINLMVYNVQEGDILVCLPGDIVELRQASDDCDIQLVAPSEELTARLPQGYELGLQQGLWLRPDPFTKRLAESYFELLWKLLNTPDFALQAATHLISSLLFSLKPACQAHTGKEAACLTRKEETFRRFLTLVARYSRLERNVDFYAGKLFLSSHYLSSIIREVSGQTVMDWINRSVILEAKVLLKHSNMLTYQVADELNFPNASFFSKFFKRMTGLTPKEYRDKA